MKTVYITGIKLISIFIILFFIIGVAISENRNDSKTCMTNSNIVNFDDISNKKIGWGLKRNSNHKQPDLGSTNMSILDKYEGMYMGNESSNKVYLTFDEGYEARLYRKNFRSVKTK